MATRGVEIKLRFERYDCSPNYTDWCTFERNLFGHGGHADDHGWSYTDVFRGLDDGGARGAALPPAPGNADDRAIVRLRRKRNKGAHTYLVSHLSNQLWIDKLSTPPFLGEGDRAFAELRRACCVVPDVIDTQDLQKEWRELSIPKDVGSSENSVLDLNNLLDAKNALIPAAEQFGEDQAAERILRCIAAASRLFAESATKELNAAAGGFPGQPGFRSFQLPAPAGGGARLRDRPAIVAYYHTQWRAAFRNGSITKAAPTKHRPSSSNTVDRGMAILQALSSPAPAGEMDDESGLSPDRRTQMGAMASMTESLRAATDAGFSLHRGTTTTSDFGAASAGELNEAAAAAEEGLETSVGFSLEICHDADDVASIEMLCNNCRGPGHIAKQCASPKRFRSFAYVAELNLRALQRAEGRAREKSNYPGGNRPAPRGQRPPFKRGVPKRFQEAHPFRRFGNPVQRQRGRSGTDSQSSQSVEGENGTLSAELVDQMMSSEISSQANLSQTNEVSRSAVLAREDIAPHELMPLSMILPTDEDPEPEDSDERGQAVKIVETQMSDEPDVLRGGMSRYSAAGILAAIITIGIAWWWAAYCVGKSYVHATIDSGEQLITRLVQTVGRGPILIGLLLLLAQLARSEAQVRSCSPDPLEYASLVFTREGWTVHGGLQLSESKRPEVTFCVDSGATCVCIPEGERWLLSEITDEHPTMKLIVASGTALDVACVGKINSPAGKVRLACKGSLMRDDRSWRQEERVRPLLGRVLVVKGLARGTRLAGVQAIKEDGILAYFNRDNEAKVENCIRLATGHYTMFRSARNCSVVFEIERGENACLRATTDSQVDGKRPAEPSRPSQDTPDRTALTTHAGLMHACASRIRSSGIVVKGIDLTAMDIGVADCVGCQRTRPSPSFPSSSAPSRGKATRGKPSRESTREPSTHGYTFFGQRMDTDICTALPRSWPHGFTAVLDFCDRHSAEWFAYFMVGTSAEEVEGCMDELERRVKVRLRDGKIWVWHIDGDLALIRASKQQAARDLIVGLAQRIPHQPNSNPVAERLFRTLEETITRTVAYAGNAPLCLWPWVVSQAEHVAYFLTTRAHKPPMSPFRFSYPDAAPADLTWAEPLFCDVVVHLAKADIDGKLAYRSTVGCYLGHDFKRNAQVVYCPELQRIGHFIVDTWIRNSFEACRGITCDTPVQYREPDDLRFSAASGIPAVISLRGGASQARCEVSPTGNDVGVHALDAHGQCNVSRECARVYRAEMRASPLGGAEVSVPDMRSYFEVELVGSETACAVVKEQSTLTKIDSVTAARRSKYWTLIKEAMEEEIRGKVANDFGHPVPYAGQRLMKTKWVIHVWLAEDGRVVKVKARLVACGYSQIEGLDYGDTSAPTLPGTCYRLFTSICALEDLDTDHIDAVKAFTQSLLDAELYCAMPEGFEIPGYVLKLRKALEGIKQGSHLWFQKNKWAWNKCGCEADPGEPNLYIHKSVKLLIAVFADDVAAGFAADSRTDYLRIRGEYGRLIKIDSPAPDTIVPLTDFVGTEWERDRASRVIKVTQRKYIYKLTSRFKGKYTLNDMPYRATKSGREFIEHIDKIPPGDSASIASADKAEFLEVLGSIGWPACMTRPELAFIFSKLGSVAMAPTAQHLECGYHVIGYLANTPNIGLKYGGELRVPPGLQNYPARFSENAGLYCVSDSSFGRTPRPHGGHVVMRANAAILWSSKKFKTVVPDSTAEAETLEGSRAAKAIMFVKNVLMGVSRPAVGSLALLCDNEAMFKLVQSTVVSQRTRHFERAATLLRWSVLRLLVQPFLVGTDYMIADIFTKAVEQDTFYRLRDWLLNADSEKATVKRIMKLLGRMMRYA